MQWGDEAILESEADFVNLMLEATAAKISDVRGQEKWDTLAINQKVHFNSKAYEQVHRALGDAAFDALSEEEQKEVNFLM